MLPRWGPLLNSSYATYSTTSTNFVKFFVLLSLSARLSIFYRRACWFRTTRVLLTAGKR